MGGACPVFLLDVSIVVAVIGMATGVTDWSTTAIEVGLEVIVVALKTEV